MNTSPRLGVKALIVRDGMVLMNRMRDGASGEIYYAAPGGGQEHGEDQREALRRECREEIGAEVEVYQVACIHEFMSRTRRADGTPREDLFHQVNVNYWCGLAPGQEPGQVPPTDPDPGQDGTEWLPIDRLGEYWVVPETLSQWLRSDPSGRDIYLGVTQREM